MTTDILLDENINIEDMIYEIRGKQVMLDSYLAKLYNCKNGTKTINQAVNRHIDRFPDDFYFQLTAEEYNFLWSQVGTTNKTNMSRTLPYVFTEQGVAMLSTILRTEIASQVSINIMRAFINIRKFIKNSLLEQQYINTLVLEHDKDIKFLQESFNKLEEKELKNKLFFNGEVFNSYL